MKIQLTTQKLQAILNIAEQNKERDSSLSDTIEIELVQECDTNEGSDRVIIRQRSSYAECDGALIGH